MALAMVIATAAPLQPALATPPVNHDVTTCTELQALGNDDATRFDTISLQATIDCSGIANFTPLYSANGYHGHFYGRGHKIKHLTLNHPSGSSIGLFAYTSDATIQDLILDSGSVTGRDAVGALIGDAQDGTTVFNVISHLPVTGQFYVGGMFGDIAPQSGGDTVTVQGSGSTGAVNAPGGFAGGLIGYISGADASVGLTQVYATGNVTGDDNDLGGLIGYTNIDTSGVVSGILIQDSYARGNVSAPGHDNIGGLIGQVITSNTPMVASTETHIRRTYASGTTSGAQAVGGLIGLLDWQNDASAYNTISDSFATGHVTATTSSLGAGLIGFYNQNGSAPANFGNNFYDRAGTGMANCGGAHPVGFCTPVNVGNLDPNYFKNNSANPPLDAWDFSSSWVTNTADYPTLTGYDDGDNVPTADEDAAPNDGDANADGLADSLQDYVASFPDPVSGHYAALESNCGSLLNAQVGGENTTPGQTDVAYTYPAGLIGFVVSGCTPGATVTVSQYFYGLSNPGQYTLRKSDAGAYTTVPGATFSTFTVGGQTVLKADYQITDGSALDPDHTADGNVEDPAGPAVLVVGVPNTGLGGGHR